MKPESLVIRLLCVCLGLSMPAFGDEGQVQLADDEGKDLVVARCAICHSLDYIPMNSPFLDAAGWAKELDKMIKFGAPVSDAELPVILRYLNANYGAPPRPGR